MPLLNPNTPTFHPSSYPYHPQNPFPHRLNRVSPDNPRRHEPGARISSLAPITGNMLDRTRIHHFGPETRLPRGGNVLTRVWAASNHQEGRQRQGQPPEVRLRSIVAPQTLFTGHETRLNGQELFHAVFLNARMLINNPLTGHPGMVNGHVLATLVAAPVDERPWPYEVAFSSSPHTRNPLAIRDRAAHAAAGPQCLGGPYRLPIDRACLDFGPTSADARIHTAETAGSTHRVEPPSCFIRAFAFHHGPACCRSAEPVSSARFPILYDSS
ncbi:hypothetical protein C8R47DRAFT_1230049 [Mycena vitilis]|nr:hypothetical protein C8R47DRAFT_1230049 [Mycena vitilis]